jgi:hypothetical protein
MERFKSLALVMCAARGLAVDGNAIVPLGRELLDPAFETPSEQARVNAIDQALMPAHAGDAEMKFREPSQKIEMLLAPCHESSKSSHEAMVAQVRSSRTSARGYTTRQGSLSSSICEKCLSRTATRARGISSSKIASMVAPPNQRPKESRLARQDKITPFWPLT